MPSYFQSRVSGAGQLDELFAQLPKAIGDEVLRKTAKSALVPVEDAAKNYLLAHIRTGNLLNSIEISTQLKGSQKEFQDKRKGDVAVYVGASSPRGNAAHLVEFGTAPRYQKNGKYV